MPLKRELLLAGPHALESELWAMLFFFQDRLGTGLAEFSMVVADCGRASVSLTDDGKEGREEDIFFIISNQKTHTSYRSRFCNLSHFLDHHWFLAKKIEDEYIHKLTIWGVK
ncbi:unnamed protein product [Cuscuta epithymum]|uniref:Uncharacterized protein n=1 Tax=Cuscuta epithymum TaxID=186058 RepID=A0AAV0D1J7_9ASTE|nr:unnamed protein product [Cuscuta epithymum]CAH9088934.1 unnamed protein product [Cuscuta epithymum]